MGVEFRQSPCRSEASQPGAHVSHLLPVAGAVRLHPASQRRRMDTKLLDKITTHFKELVATLPAPRELPAPDEFRQWVMDLISEELYPMPSIIPLPQIFSTMCTNFYLGFIQGSVYTHQRGLPQFVIPFLTEGLENPGE